MSHSDPLFALQTSNLKMTASKGNASKPVSWLQVISLISRRLKFLFCDCWTSQTKKLHLDAVLQKSKILTKEGWEVLGSFASFQETIQIKI